MHTSTSRPIPAANLGPWWDARTELLLPPGVATAGETISEASVA